MQDMPILTLGAGALLLLLKLLLGVTHVATLGKVHAPQSRSIDQIRNTETQFKTVVAPALAALISSLFVSLAASFFFADLIAGKETWYQTAGLLTFVMGTVALLLILRFALADGGDHVELIRDPFRIFDVANEIAVHPRASKISPEVLTVQLNEWEKHISPRSLNISTDRTSTDLDKTFKRCLQVSGKISSIRQSFALYYAALRRYPIRFGWPILGSVFFVGGFAWYRVASLGMNIWTLETLWLEVVVLFIVEAFFTQFYCWARGNQSRRWYCVYSEAVEDAREAIANATTARDLDVADEELLHRTIARADSVLDCIFSNAGRYFELCLGKIHIRLHLHMDAGLNGPDRKCAKDV